MLTLPFVEQVITNEMIDAMYDSVTFGDLDLSAATKGVAHFGATGTPCFGHGATKESFPPSARETAVGQDAERHREARLFSLSHEVHVGLSRRAAALIDDIDADIKAMQRLRDMQTIATTSVSLVKVGDDEGGNLETRALVNSIGLMHSKCISQLKYAAVKIVARVLLRMIICNLETCIKVWNHQLHADMRLVLASSEERTRRAVEHALSARQELNTAASRIQAHSPWTLTL